MSVLTDLIFSGASAMAGLAEGAVKDAVDKYGPEKAVAFPDTAYYFPAIYATTGLKVETLEDLTPCVAVIRSLIVSQPDLSQALNAGLAAALAAEILEGLKCLDEGRAAGSLSDQAVRTLAMAAVPGVAVVFGSADKAGELADIVRDYQARGLLTFLVGDAIEQCAQEGVELGPEKQVLPLGHDVTALAHLGSAAVRTAMLCGGVQPGDLAGLLTYTKTSMPAFLNTFGTIDAVVISVGAGAIALGFPVVVDIDLGENQIPGTLESVCDHSKTVNRSLELREILRREDEQAP
ncbi:MAG: hypothetical protein Q4F17_00060 [Eubacteriales bacterium]|nr:hypothetical protein [Eubacteriales bacterium]